jgi:hypothetical protein
MSWAELVQEQVKRGVPGAELVDEQAKRGVPEAELVDEQAKRGSLELSLSMNKRSVGSLVLSLWMNKRSAGSPESCDVELVEDVWCGSRGLRLLQRVVRLLRSVVSALSVCRGVLRCTAYFLL